MDRHPSRKARQCGHLLRVGGQKQQTTPITTDTSPCETKLFATNPDPDAEEPEEEGDHRDAFQGRAAEVEVDIKNLETENRPGRRKEQTSNIRRTSTTCNLQFCATFPTAPNIGA